MLLWKTTPHVDDLTERQQQEDNFTCESVFFIRGKRLELRLGNISGLRMISQEENLRKAIVINAQQV